MRRAMFKMRKIAPTTIANEPTPTIVPLLKDLSIRVRRFPRPFR